MKWLCITPRTSSGSISISEETRHPGPRNNSCATPSSTLRQVNDTRVWPDGKPITIVLRDPSSADMQLILRRVFNMTADEARTFIHTHAGIIVVADSDDAIQRFVANTRGAIGVVDLYSLTKDVRVVKIDGKLPVEQGYLLRGN
jgi:ABC-type phosphate transport system substrate-binding protein